MEDYWGKIDIFSHYFLVTVKDIRLGEAVRAFTLPLVQKELKKRGRRFIPTASRVYARRSLRSNSFGFHINSIESFFELLKEYDVPDYRVKVTRVPMFKPKKFHFDSDFALWEDQIPITNHLVEEDNQRAATVQPGGGKTIMSLDAARQFGYRFAVVTQGGYEDRWLPAMRDQLKLKVDEIRSCCGAIAICDLIKEKMKKGIDDVKAVFISIAGIRAYIKNYEAGKYKGTMWEAVPPENLYEFLEIGLRITDEAHKDIHANFISDLYTHIPYTIYLTATLIARDEFMGMIYELYIPAAKRKEMDNLNVYVKCIEVEYYLQDPHSVNWKSQDGMYSHTVYEQWIMKKEDRLQRYIKGIYDYALIPWLAERLYETKMIFFVATIEMGRILAEYLQRRCPDLVIQQYKAGDPYDILVDSDVIVSTILKAGTAVDIPDLERTHCTVAIDSPNAIIQVLGRLRQLKQLPDVQCKFYYYTCLHIPRHLDYSKKKRVLLKDRVLSFETEPLGIRV